jgi:hypothetical protein
MKIGIVGNAISTEDLKRRSKGYELWGINNLYRKFQGIPFSRWFEIHEFSCQKGIFTRRGHPTFAEEPINQYLKDLDALGIPIYMRRKYKRIKQARVFPFRAIMKKYGSYFGCSMAWMTALAIEEGADEIGFYGITLDGNEYYYQRPSVEYFIGLAKGQGIKIYIDKTCRLLKSNYSYAYKEDFGLIYALHGELTKELTEIITAAVTKKIDDFWVSWRKGI